MRTGSRKWTIKVAVGLFLAAVLITFFVSIYQWGDQPPVEPVFEGQPLRYWINADPPDPVTYDATIKFRTRPLRAMGEPAVKYLRWMLQHPRQCLNDHWSTIERSCLWLIWRHYLPKWLNGRIAPPANRQNFMEVVLGLEFIGPAAHEAAPDLVRLWESKGNYQYQSYNGFPLALAMIGNASPGVLSALHRPFESPDRLHGSLCAFAAWRLDPSDATAIARICRELDSRDAYAHARYTLLDEF